MIHLLDRNEQIIDVLVNPSQDKSYDESKITVNADTALLTLDFTTSSTISFDDIFKVIAQDQDGIHRLFIVSDIDKSRDDSLKQIVECDGDQVSLGFARPIAPTTLTGVTLKEAAVFILQDLDYQLGQVDYMGIDDVVFKEFLDPFASLQQIKDQFKCVLSFRVEITGQTFTKFVDLLAPSDVFDGKELVLGKDITGIDRKESRGDIVTRMVGEAFDQDGEVVTFESINDGKNYVSSPDAYEQWNMKGEHRYGIHEYQLEDSTLDTNNGEIDLEKMLAATYEALENTNKADISYEVTAAALETIPGLEHEKIRAGMNVRIKDEGFSPALFLEAKVVQTEMPELDDPSGDFTYTFGDYQVVSVNMSKQLADLQSRLNRRSPVWDGSRAKADAAQQSASDAKDLANSAQDTANEASNQVINLGKAVDGKSTIIASPTAPTDTTDFWIDTSGKPSILKHYDTSTKTWVKASPTDFVDLGGQVDNDQIAPKAVTVDKMEVAELSTITEKVGELTGGILNGMEINGATIQSIIDAKNFLQIIGNTLHIEGENPDRFEYFTFDVGTGQFKVEFGGLDNGSRFPIGQFTTRTGEVVIATLEETGEGIVISPGAVAIYFGTDAVASNRAMIQGAGALNGAGAIDIIVSMRSGGVLRVRNHATTTERPGDIEAGNISVSHVIQNDLSGSKLLYLQTNGGQVVVTNDGTLTNLAPIMTDTVYTSHIENGFNVPGNNIYIRPRAAGRVAVTRAGTTDVFQAIVASDFVTSSLEIYKTDITPWTDTVADWLKTIQLYNYYLKVDVEDGKPFKKYGIVIGEGYSPPDMIITEDGDFVDLQNVAFLGIKGAQEALLAIDDLKNKNKDLETQLEDLQKRVEALEGQKDGN